MKMGQPELGSTLFLRSQGIIRLCTQKVLEMLLWRSSSVTLGPILRVGSFALYRMEKCKTCKGILTWTWGDICEINFYRYLNARKNGKHSLDEKRIRCNGLRNPRVQRGPPGFLPGGRQLALPVVSVLYKLAQYPVTTVWLTKSIFHCPWVVTALGTSASGVFLDWW